MSLTHYQADAEPDRMLADLHEQGAIIIDDLIDAAALTDLRTELDPYMEASRDGQDSFTGYQTTRTGGLVMRSPACRELIQDPLILKLCDGFLLDYCERYQLHLTQIIRLRPGQGEQMIHRDRWAWGKHLGHLEPQLNTIWESVENFYKTGFNGIREYIANL